MKRVQEKIKDLVDVRTYETVKNFASDAAATVAAYRFTDVTSDLMAKWLDEIVEIGQRRAAAAADGSARALAGNRGVGKSHFLAVLGALIAQPELRTKITDQHVGLSAQRLPRSRHTVIRLERGLSDSLAEEMQTALAKTFGTLHQDWGANPAQMLRGVAAQAGELPLIVIVDSAFERKGRVKRDDGALLGEMAEVARENGIFLAIALDDDIAGADGVNAAIARTCAIEYLDQEHLYRIVDAFLYQKRPPARAVLRELYQEFRRTAPGFNWSEPRFAALYPIHPVVVDITPAVRLYAPQFAFLPFAADNAAKVMNRPAHSLLALDEVFDRIEPDLRKSVELADIFAVYDELAAETISQIPIMQRLQAKLVLKGLLLTSLDGRGATAKELGAAMLIYDEDDPAAAVAKIAETVAMFAAAVGENKLRRTIENDETRFLIGNSAAAEFEIRLAAAAQAVEPEIVGRVLRLSGAARFPDWRVADAASLINSEIALDNAVNWRGSVRRGGISWLWHEKRSAELFRAAAESDWQIFIVAAGENVNRRALETPPIVWQSAALRPDEEDVIRRFAALSGNIAMSEEFGETAIAVEQTTAAIIERIWTRIFLDEGKLIFENEIYEFTSEAKAAQTLNNALEIALAPIFERRFPAHPNFTQTLNEVLASEIVSDFFGGANASTPETQRLAEIFVEPLGLAARREINLTLETDENLLKLPLVQIILEFTAAANGAAVSYAEINAKLSAPPHGLQRDAQNLLLAALVARRRLEFVTTSGNRITHRSLDLRIVWADVTGAAQSSIQPRAAAELAAWASRLTHIENLRLSDDAADREQIRAALGEWLDDWRLRDATARFAALPDEVLNVRAWRLSVFVARSFGLAATAIEFFFQDDSSLEECLEAVIDAFNDAPETIEESRRQIFELENFINAALLRHRVWRYAARAEKTDDARVEALRRDILDELEIPENAFDETASEAFNAIWLEFQALYSENYLARHNAALHSATRAQTLERIEASAEFKEFLGLAGLPVAHSDFLKNAERLGNEIKNAKCNFDTRRILQTEPFCACNQQLVNIDALDALPNKLTQTIQQGRLMVRRVLQALAAPLSTALLEIARRESNPIFVERAGKLADLMQRGQELPLLSALDLRLLKLAAEKMPVPTVRVRSPRGFGALPREEMRSKLNLWLDNLPNAPVLVKFQEEE